MIRSIVFRLLFCRIPKNDEWVSGVCYKKVVFNNYKAFKIVHVRFFTLPLHQL